MKRRSTRAADPLFEFRQLVLPTRLPGFPDVAYSPISAQQFTSAVGPVLESFLAPLGFEPAKPLLWVRSTRGPWREVFELGAGKGASHFPDWGFSLDFVPHVVGRAVRWHDSPMEARFDLRGATPWTLGTPDEIGVTSHWGLDGARGQALANLPRWLELARVGWKSVRRESDLLDLFAARMRSHQRRNAWDLPFSCIRQHPLAYAFVLARAGQKRNAARWFQTYLRHENLHDSTTRRLRELFADARRRTRAK